MSDCIIHCGPHTVRRRLRELELEFSELIRVIEAMRTAYNGTTDNDPPSAAGWDAWRFGTRRFRELKRAQDWEKNDNENLSTVVHPSGGFRIAVANTDAGTGLRTFKPKNKSQKGAGSERAVNLNQQPLPLPEFLEEFERQLKAAQAANARIWYLCVHIDGETVRAELSFPRSIDGGYFSDWDERIVLIDDGGPVCDSDDRDDPYAPEFDVPVRRRG